MDKQAEMSKELRRARGWILAVGLIMIATDMIVLFGVYRDQLTPEYVRWVLIADAVIFAFFIGMWALAKRKPLLACVLALCGFWALQLFNAWEDPSTLGQGILLKILFTLALIKGMKSANRAELLKKELEQVFG